MWPTQTEYQDALQNPALCFADPDLKNARPDLSSPLGLPTPITGHFANVYRLAAADGTAAWAVRLFLQDTANTDREKRCRALSEHLARLPSFPAFLVPFEYQPQGIRIRGAWFPLIKMPWLENAVPLNEAVEATLNDPDALTALAERWRNLLRGLRMAHMAHGDLQHGNVLVEKEADALRLLDYDGVWVPSLAGRDGTETGHPAYQHPRRSAGDFGPQMDRFAGLAVYVALRALVHAPELWYRLDNGDNLLFGRDDFANPAASRAFALLRQVQSGNDVEFPRLMQALQAACIAPLSHVPDLDTLVGSTAAVP